MNKHIRPSIEEIENLVNEIRAMREVRQNNTRRSGRRHLGVTESWRDYAPPAARAVTPLAQLIPAGGFRK